jgi:PhnB protein
MSTTSETKTLTLAPYIFFYGRCEEALAFYKSVLGGTYEIVRVKDTPMASQMPPQAADKVMHASFSAPGIAFFASDGREIKTIDPDAGNISLALTAPDRASGERVFNALAAGGNAKMPLTDAFWGGRFGMLDDRFGNEWMITTP